MIGLVLAGSCGSHLLVVSFQTGTCPLVAFCSSLQSSRSAKTLGMFTAVGCQEANVTDQTGICPSAFPSLMPAPLGPLIWPASTHALVAGFHECMCPVSSASTH